MRFVGRATELAVLRAEAELARRGACRVLLLGGDAGVGKSRLLNEFLRESGDAFQCARASCPGVADAAPLWPWRQLLTALGAPIATLPTTAEGAGFAERTRYAQALVTASKTAPVLIALEDLHRADEASLALLSYVADSAPDSPILVVGTHRNELALALPAGPAVTRIALRGLSTDDVAELAADMLGTALPSPVAAQLRRRTDGNPYLVGVVVGQVDPADARTNLLDRLAISWPEEIRTAAEARLAVLSPASRAVLAAAAVIGREFDLVLLERIAIRSDGDVIDALDEAIRHRVVTPRVGQVYAFVRAIDREVVYEACRARDRALLHEAAAHALMNFTAFVGERGPTAAELAHHLVNAAVLGGRERLELAIAYTVVAATLATEQCRVHDAVAHHMAALQLAIRAAWEPSAVGRLLVAVGVARLAAGALAAGQDSLAAAARLGRQASDAGLLAAAAIGYGPRAGLGETAPPPDDELVALLTEAIEATYRSTPEDLSTIARLHARLAIELAGSPEAERHAGRATDAAQESADPRAVAEACLARAAVTTPKTSVDLRPALGAAAALGDVALECRARLAAGAVALAAADLTSADRELSAVAAAEGHPYALWCASLAAAHRGLLAGDLTAAERLATQALALGESVAPLAAARTHAVQCAAAALARGVLSDLAPVLASLGRTTPVPAWLPALSALVAVERGDRAVAAVLLAEELGDADQLARQVWRLALTAEVALALGDKPAMVRLAPLLDPYDRSWIVLGPAVANVGPVALTLARLRLAAGDLRSAASAIDLAATTVGATVWLPHVRLVRARWLIDRGRTEDGEAALREARAARIGAADRAFVVDRADELIAHLAAHSGTGLTRREQEVAALAIAGASAREIAERLVVGERTVETHLANIYRKLGVRSRVELITRFGGSSSR